MIQPLANALARWPTGHAAPVSFSAVSHNCRAAASSCASFGMRTGTGSPFNRNIRSGAK